MLTKRQNAQVEQVRHWLQHLEFVGAHEDKVYYYQRAEEAMRLLREALQEDAPKVAKK